MFMRTTPTCTYDPADLIASTWVIISWLIDAKTLVLSPTIATNVNVIKPSIATTELEPNVAIQATY